MPCRLALLVFLLASAPRASKTPESLVKEKLLAPLAAREKARSSYSRARPPAAERRVRQACQPMLPPEDVAILEYQAEPAAVPA